MTYGIVAIGAYVPRLRLARRAIADAHRWMNPSLRSLAKGNRAFCSWDEDSVTMAVEAARDCLSGRNRDDVRALTLASTTFPYADLSGAAIVASALALSEDIRTANAAGSQRAATTALIDTLNAARGPALLVASERSTTQPASVAEIQTGAGAAAILMGEDEVAAVLLASASRSAHFVDRFRASDQPTDYGWEERWIRDEGYAKLVPGPVVDVLEMAGITAAEIAHFILPTPVRGVAASLAKTMGLTSARIAGDFANEVGYCGAAHGAMMLAEALGAAKPGDRILMVGFGQGVDALLFEATGQCGGVVLGRGMAGAVADGLATDDYLRMLSFYDRIALDWGMRGEKTGKAALTEQFRSADRIDSFTGGKCTHCGTVQFPVLAYCVNPDCLAPAEAFSPFSLADQPAHIFTITSDWLSYHPAPPLAVGFIQFDVGARLLMELVDAAPAQIVEGQPVRMVFRIKERDRARGYNRYFWKATPLAAPREATDG